MEEEDIFLPLEIIEHIVSYLPTSSTSRVSRSFYEANMRTYEEKVEGAILDYGTPDKAALENDWDSVRLLLSVMKERDLIYGDLYLLAKRMVASHHSLLILLIDEYRERLDRHLTSLFLELLERDMPTIALSMYERYKLSIDEIIVNMVVSRSSCLTSRLADMGLLEQRHIEMLIHRIEINT